MTKNSSSDHKPKSKQSKKKVDVEKVKKVTEKHEIEKIKKVTIPVKLDDKKTTEKRKVEKVMEKQKLEKVTEEPKVEKVTEEQEAEKVTEKQNEEKVTEKQNAEKVTEKQNAEKVTEKQNAEKVTEKQEAKNLPDEQKAEKPAEKQNVEKVTEKQEVKKVTENQDVEKVTEMKKVETVTENEKVEKMTEKREVEMVMEKQEVEKVTEMEKVEEVTEMREVKKPIDEEVNGLSKTVVHVTNEDKTMERDVSQAKRSQDQIGIVKLMQCGYLEIDEERQRRVAMMESLCQVNGSKTTSSSSNSSSSSSISSSSSSSSSTSSISSSSSSISSISSGSSTKSSSNGSTGGGGGVNNSSKCHRDSNNQEYSDPQQRLAVLSFEQVRRLNDVMNEVVSIHGRGNFPTLEVRLRDLVTVVRSKLEDDPSNGGAGMRVRDIRLNGGAASHVLATESQPYNDLDLIFAVELSSGRNYDKVKAAVLGSLFDLLPEGVSRKRITTCSLKEAYVSKMVKVNNDGDRWSLISLGNSRGHRNVELKFVDTMRRQFEFSVDSFQIVLDSLLLFYECSKLPIGENFYPTVVGESVYGDFQEALYHLHKKLISTRHPEEIRGGGLLKYCNLLVKMYKASQPDYIKTLERYMCSRFFIDFPDVGQQQAKLENYLWNHFVGPEEEALKYQYLMLLHSVVEESTVCLMGHERRQTLALIENLAFQVLCQEQQRLNSQQAPPGPQATYVYANGYANGYYYAPVIPTACYTCTCTSWMACSS